MPPHLAAAPPDETSGSTGMADDRRDKDGGEGQGPFSEGDLARRFDRLSRALDGEKRERLKAAGTGPAGRTGYGAAMRLASEFIAGILVGAAIGWGIDQLFGSSPWGLIVFLLLGFVAGTLNVVRAAGGLSPRGSAANGKDAEPR
ncbi:MAG TPA: AtpZ/AtpI family protein [Afifellaceae bacterium]|nr:AtpZ/AtpI family protein [Afifellaceae bacterium]